MNQLRAFFVDCWSLVSNGDNRTLSLFWISCLAGVVGLTIYINTRASGFMGIADTRESIINFEYPVSVRRIHVLSGQLVEKGDLIAELIYPDLDIKVQQLKSQISTLKAQQKLKSEMNHLGSLFIEGGAAKKVAEVDSSSDPLATQIRSLQAELEMMIARGKELFVFAEITGVIGSVNFKRGETISPYTPLTSISPLAPTNVQGFIYENLQASLRVGQKMSVVSRADSTKSVEARIISISSRIVQFPIRLAQNPAVAIWGREVILEIPNDNSFLLGEKVEVYEPKTWIGFSSAVANSAGAKKTTPAKKGAPAEVMVPDEISKASSVELSGALYLADLNKFLVVTDDTDGDDSPWLLLLNLDGSLDAPVVQLSGVVSFQDIESITQDENGNIFIMGSQGHSRSGKLRRLRHLLIKVERKGMDFRAKGTVILRPLILDALKKSKDAELKAFASDAEKNIEVEASAIRGGKLYIGLKGPYDSSGRSLVLDLGNPDDLFSKNKIAEIKLAYRFEFPVEAQKETWISDMMMTENKMYLTTISKSPGKTGRVWEFDLKTEALTLLTQYPSFSPEGIALNTRTNELMIVFDESSEPPRYDKISLQ